MALRAAADAKRYNKINKSKEKTQHSSNFKIFYSITAIYAHALLDLEGTDLRLYFLHLRREPVNTAVISIQPFNPQNFKPLFNPRFPIPQLGDLVTPRSTLKSRSVCRRQRSA